MDTRWIERVMETNARIVAAEARFAEHVAHLVEAAGQGRDITQEEWLFVSHRISIDLLRTIQTEFLRETTASS